MGVNHMQIYVALRLILGQKAWNITASGNQS